MDRIAVKKYKERWQRVNEVMLEEQLKLSPETKLRQSTALLRIARRLGWDIHGSEDEIQSVRRKWIILRTRVHDRPS
jgi:hypothetical protein